MSDNMTKAIDTHLPTLVVFCKRPLIYQGKQRLAATIGAESAFCIAEYLLDCALEDATAWPGQVVLTISNKEDAIWASSLLNRQYSILVQNQGNLGQRINSIDKQLRALGHDKLVFIGTDAPMLNSAHYQQVIQGLANNDVVLSKADDGGVVIMANSQPWPDIEKLAWSTETLGAELAEESTKHGLNVEYITPGYDIDIEQDLRKLKLDLIKDQRPARKALVELVEQLTQDDYAANYA